MTIELAILISAVSFVLALIQTIFNFKKTNRNETKVEATQLTTVIVKLENISNDINELKSDLRDMKSDLKDHTTRIVRLEQQMKVVNNKIFDKE